MIPQVPLYPAFNTCTCARFSVLVLFVLTLLLPNKTSSQNSDLPCNLPTPWMADDFDLDVTVGNTGIACWDGQCIILGDYHYDNVADDDINSVARGNIVLSGSLSIRVEDPNPTHTYPGGNYVGFLVESGILNIQVLSGLVIRTWNNGSVQETHSDFELIGVDVDLGNDPVQFGFVTSEDFDAIELIIGTGLGIGTFDVHYAINQTFCPPEDTLACNVPTAMNIPAQPMTVDYTQTGAIDINLGTVGDPENVISANPNDFAVLNDLVNALDTLSIAVEDQITDHPAGTYVGFEIQNTSVLYLNLLDDLIITTYLNGVEQEQIVGEDLALSAGLLTLSDRYRVGLVTTTAVDKIKLSLAVPVSISLGSTNVYAAIFQNFCAGDTLECNTPTAMNLPDYPVTVDYVSTGLLDINLGVITGPDNVISANPNDFATLSDVVNVLDTVSIAVQDNVTDYPAGTYVGFEIQNLSVLSVDLLEDLILTSYLNGAEQEVIVGSELLLSTGLLSGNDRHTVGFVTSTPVDRIKLSQVALANVNLGNTLVYKAIFQKFCAGDTLLCNVPTPMNFPDHPVTVDYTQTGLLDIGLGYVGNPDNVISPDPNDFTTLSDLVNVLDTLSIAVQDQVTDYPAGTYVGFEIQNTTVLNLDLLDDLILTTYLNGVEQEQIESQDILLSVPLLENTGRYSVGFVTTLPVDKVKLSLVTPANVNVGNTLVYHAIFQKFCVVDTLECNVFTPVHIPDYPVYINPINTGFDNLICVGCSITQPDNVIDDDPNSFTLVDLTVAVGASANLAVKDAITDYPAGTFAGFHIENINLLDADVWSGVTITTFLNGSPAESAQGEDVLVSAGTDLLVNQGAYFAGFVTTEPYDEVVLTLSNLVNVTLGTTIVYEAIFGKFCEGDIACDTTIYLTTPDYPVYIDFTETGFDGVACALCEVEDPEEVITESNTDYATITVPVGVLGSASLAVRDALIDYPAGTFAGFVIHDINDILQLDLFGSLTISVFRDGELVDFRTGGSLLDAEVLILFINDDAGVYYVGFEPDEPFDEIKISVGALASVINVIRVYGAFVDTRNSYGDTTLLDCVVPPSIADDVATTMEEVPVSIDVLENDTDGDSPIGEPIMTEAPDHGTVTYQPGDSTFLYTPDEDFSGVDSFYYQLCDIDAGNLCDTALVVVTVVPVRDTVIYTIPEDSTITVCAGELSTLSSGPDQLLLCDVPQDGDLILADICVTYTPDANFNGSDTFCVYQCLPGMTGCDTTIIIINVDPEADGPDAVDDNATTNEEVSVNIDVLDNDSDPDSELNEPIVVDEPSNGDVTYNPADSTFTYTPDPDFVGTDVFTYSICDIDDPALCDIATVTVDVLPVIDTIEVNVPEDSTETFCADDLTTFTSSATSISVCDGGDNGTTVVNDVCVEYTPDPGFNGNDTICVYTCDPSDPSLCDTTIITITVDPDADGPNAVDDNATTNEEVSVNIDVLDNDSDPDSELNEPIVVDEPSYGDVTYNPADSTFTYAPDPDFVGTDVFTYSICDIDDPALCDIATVTIDVLPVIDTIEVNVPEDSTETFCAGDLTTFTSSATSISICDGGENGTTVVNDVCVEYTPDPGFNGNDTICVYTCDPSDPSLCDTTIIIITVDPDADGPYAVDDNVTTDEDVSVSIDVLDNDSDPDSELNEPIVVDEPLYGDVTYNPADSTFTYAPDPDFVGTDVFTYSICDIDDPALCDIATVTVDVLPVIDTIEVNVPEDSTETFCADDLTTFTSSATSISVCDGGDNGTTVINDVCVEYTPDPGFNGNDTICVYTCDPSDPGLCDTTIIIITIDPDADGPNAVDDNVTTDEDVSVSIDVLDNDSDPDSELNEPIVVDEPLYGDVTYNLADSTFTYAPDPDFVGTDVFTYSICDIDDPALCDIATVTVDVLPVIDTIEVNVPEDSTETFCADDLTTFTLSATSISVCDGGDNGTTVVNDVCVEYTPDPGFNGNDTICVYTCDPSDLGLCDTTIIIITVDPEADGPNAEDDEAFTDEDSPIEIDVLVNDSDPDSDLDMPNLVDPPSKGSVDFNPADSTFMFMPEPSFVGMDTFSYSLCDLDDPSLCDTAMVMVLVGPVRDTINIDIPEDSTATVCAGDLTVFTTPATSISICENGDSGTAVVDDDCVIYTPNPGFNGMDTICVYTCDPNDAMLCDTTIVIITVHPVNEPPVALDDVEQGEEDTPVNINVLANDSDPDDPLGAPSVTSEPLNGSTFVEANNTITYTPDPGL